MSQIIAENPAPESPSDQWTADISVARVGDRSILARRFARAPLKLLSPKSPGRRAAWVVMSSYGGGLVAGDVARIRIYCDRDTTTLVSTQSSTKVYRSEGLETIQQIHATVEDDATLLIAPDPTTCFANARFSQALNVELAPSASLLLLDWYTSGRHAGGERWAFARQRNLIDVQLGGRPLLRDVQLLDPIDGELASPARLGRFNCVATLLLVGRAMKPLIEAARANVTAMPVSRSSPILASASPLGDNLILRAAAEQTQSIAHWLRDLLTLLPADLAEYWNRKW